MYFKFTYKSQSNFKRYLDYKNNMSRMLFVTGRSEYIQFDSKYKKDINYFKFHLKVVDC